LIEEKKIRISFLFRAHFLVTLKMPEEDLPPLSETGIEPAPLRLPNFGPPHAGDAACIVIPSRSLPSSLRTSMIDQSRTNSIDYIETEGVRNSVPDDLIIF
jgi:hypothetical protein